MFWHIYVVCFQPNLPWSIDHFPAGCWHWRLAWCFFVFVWACWRLVPHRSKVKTGNSCSWKQIMKQIMFETATNHETNHVWNSNKSWNKSCLEQNAGIFFVARCWERVQFFLTGLCFFGEADGDGGVWACWRLVPHRSKLQIGKSQCKLATNHVWNRMLDFFSWQEVGKESSLLTGLCIFVWWGWRWDPTDNLHVFFGFLWACWRWVPHRSQNQNWEETIFFKGQSPVLYHEYHTPCAPAQNTHHAYHFQIGSTIKITQTQSPRLQFLDWPTPPRWPFPGSIRGGGADEED